MDGIKQILDRKSKETIKKKNMAQIDTKILIFTAAWADLCFYTAPLWYKFASKFGTSKVTFFEIDIKRHP